MDGHIQGMAKSTRPRLVIWLTDAVNLPEEYTLGSTPANATSFLASLNRSISPISEIIVAAIFSPIPGIDALGIEEQF